MDTTKNEYITVSIHLKVDGELHKMKEVNYQRGRETYAFTLDDLGRIIFQWEHMLGSGSTYAMDGFLQKAEKKLPKNNGETAQSVFDKYWVNLKETIEKEFQELNKGDKNDKYPLFPEQDDYLKYLLSQLCITFETAPLPVKYGFLHYLFKHKLNSSFEEFKQEIKNIPKKIKEIVDSIIK